MSKMSILRKSQKEKKIKTPNCNFESFLKPLIILSNIFALPVPSVKNRSAKLSKLYILYALLMIIMLIYSLVWSMRRSPQLYVDASRYLEIILISNLVLTNVVSIIWTVFIQRKSLVKFIKTMRQIDLSLKIDKELSARNYCLFVLQLILLHLFVFSCGAYETWSLVSVFGFDAYKSHAIFYLNIYMVTLTVMKVYHFSMALKYRFALLNRKLLQSKKIMLIGHLYDKNLVRAEPNFRFYRRNHLLLSDLVMLMGNAFGTPVLCITMIIIVFIIQGFNMAVNYGSIANGDSDVAFKMIFMCVWNTGMFLIFAIMMAASCEQTIKEKDKTQKICHKLLIQLPIVTSKSQTMIRDEFRLLAKQIEQREVKFSAAGFFTIDHTLLLTIFGSIASYVIIIIQFF